MKRSRHEHRREIGIEQPIETKAFSMQSDEPIASISTPPEALPFPWAVAVTLLVLIGVIEGHLLTALLAGLLVHQLVLRLAHRWNGRRGRIWGVALIGGIVIVALSGLIVGIVSLLDGKNGLAGVITTMGTVVEHTRGSLPNWAANFLPQPGAIQSSLMHWAERHSASLQSLGRHTLEGIVRLIIGMVLGALIALDQQRVKPKGRLPQLIADQAQALAESFDRVVFAQIKISAVNTILTALFVFVALPLFGTVLPFSKTLVLLTFLAGLLPVVGNLISNTAIVLVGLSVAPGVGIAALVFLILVHKLEYFLNARIVGSQIQARSWEILLAMVVGEAIFGVPGVVMAPIAYAYSKHELMRRGWV